MTYDVAHSRITMFGGKTDAVNGLDETWTFDGSDWTQLHPATAPSPRIWASSAYDTVRNRTVLYGGQFTTADLKTTTNYYDTWEFDGTNWTQIATNGPQVTTPLLAYDEATQQMILLGSDTDAKPHMYSYDNKGTWTEMKPSTMPDCVVDAGLVYQGHDPKVLVLYAGVCSDSGSLATTYEYDGVSANWQKVDAVSSAFRLTGEAIAYDPSRRETLIFGGTEAFSVPQSATYVYREGVWARPTIVANTPSPRSLFGFTTDPARGVVWLIAGQDDLSTLGDVWKYTNGTWQQATTSTSPAACVTASSVYDSDRGKLVVLCQDASLYEFDGATWKIFNTADLKTHPQVRRFSSMAYDATLKKTVLFGGFNDINYLDETWMWDGATWTQVKKNLPPPRSHSAMWFDPVMKKTLIYGGIGQRSSNDRIERYSDMWSFDGSGWTEMKSVTTTPGQRYGAQVAVDPLSNTVWLFGGLKLVVDGLKQSQVYSNDLWQWDGTKWTQVSASAPPPERENGGLAFDPISNELVLFGGYAGYYRSDVWGLRNGQWVLKAESLPQPRRRGVKH
jgi:hypothetical protein